MRIHHQTFQDGALVGEDVVEAPDAPPPSDERIAALEAQVEAAAALASDANATAQEVAAAMRDGKPEQRP